MIISKVIGLSYSVSENDIYTTQVLICLKIAHRLSSVHGHLCPAKLHPLEFIAISVSNPTRQYLTNRQAVMQVFINIPDPNKQIGSLIAF